MLIKVDEMKEWDLEPWLIKSYWNLTPRYRSATLVENQIMSTEYLVEDHI